MTRILTTITLFLFAVLSSCTKDTAPEPAEETTKFPVPEWAADDTGKYPATMTAVFELPGTVAGNAGANDQLAAFINGSCRGVGIPVDVSGVKLFFVLIQGLPEETSQIAIRYYNYKTSYMYESQAALNFLADGSVGTAENPQTLALIQLK